MWCRWGWMRRERGCRAERLLDSHHALTATLVSRCMWRQVRLGASPLEAGSPSVGFYRTSPSSGCCSYVGKANEYGKEINIYGALAACSDGGSTMTPRTPWPCSSGAFAGSPGSLPSIPLTMTHFGHVGSRSLGAFPALGSYDGYTTDEDAIRILQHFRKRLMSFTALATSVFQMQLAASVNDFIVSIAALMLTTASH